MSRTLFLNPSGTLVNYTNLSINDSTSTDSYTINWSRNSSALPNDYFSFAQKYVNISTASGTVSIDKIVWHWTADDLALQPYFNETRFELWKYNSSGWGTALNKTPDLSNKELSLTNMNPASIYAILQNNISNCPVITSSGTYTQTQNFTGAPNNATTSPGTVCVKIAAPNVVWDCNGFNITHNASGTTYGILVNSSATNVTIKNCAGISRYFYGIYVYESNTTNITNNTIYNITQGGIRVSYNSFNSSITNNTIYNASYGILADYGRNISISYNIIHNNTLEAIGLDTSANCTVTNNLAYNASIGIGIYSTTNNSVFTNNTLYNNTYGIEFYDSSNNTFTNNTIYNNTYGTWLQSGSNNTFVNNSFCNNTQSGIIITEYSNNTKLFNNTACNNNLDGIAVYNRSSGTVLANNTAYNNTRAGIYVFNSTSNAINDSIFYRNGYDFRVRYSASFNMSRTLFLNPAGTLVNFTNLSINDSVAGTEEYFVNWSRNSSALPTDYLSFAQKYVNISTASGTVSIDKIVWHWTDADVALQPYYNDTKFELWKYNVSGWGTALNTTPDFTNNALSLSAMNPASIYAILQNNITNCPVITSAGTYTQTQNFTGAPNSASPLSNFTCLKIAASNVVWDCNGYNITNNGTAGTTYGILLNGSLTNVTVKNCPGISGYYEGIYVYRSNDSTITNNTVRNNSWSGIYAYQSNNTNLANNTAWNNTYGIYCYGSRNNTLIGNSVWSDFYGIFLYVSYNSTATNNSAWNNAYAGIYLDYRDSPLSYYTAFNNSAWNNTVLGIYAANSSIFNNRAWNNSQGITGPNSTIFNNSAWDNTYGIVAIQSNSTIFNNTAWNNTYGIFIASSANGSVLINNSAWNNLQRGIYLSSSSNNILTNNSAWNNSVYGFYLESGSNSNRIINNTAWNNLADGFYIATSNNNTLANNRAYGHTFHIIDRSGFVFENSPNNTMVNNTAYNNSYGFFIFASPNNTVANNTVYNNTINGFSFNGQSGGNNVTNNIAHSNRDHGFQFIQSSGNNTLTNNSAYNNSVTGIGFYSSNNNTLINNTARNNTWGVYLFTSNNSRLTNNSAWDNTNNGFWLYGSYDNSLTNNSAWNNRYGFYIDSSGGNALTNNSAYNNTHGFNVSSSNANNLTNNTVWNSTQYGFYVGSSASNTFNGNDAHDNGYSGFYLLWSNGNNFTNNSARNQLYSTGFWLQDSNYSTLTGNTAYGNVNGFEIANSEGNRLTGNLAYDQAQWGFSLTYVNSSNITNNTARNNDMAGFSVSASDYNNLAANLAYGNGGTGFDVAGSDSNNLTNNSAYLNQYDGILFESASAYNRVENSTVHSNSGNGFSLQDSGPYNVLLNNTAWNNGEHGFLASFSTYNDITGCLAYDNNWSGFAVQGADSGNNTLTNNIAYGHTAENRSGFAIFRSSDNNLTNNTAHGNYFGLLINNAPNQLLNVTVLSNNTYDFILRNTLPAPYAYNATNLTFLNPLGTYPNHTILDVSDSVATGDLYYMNWSSNTSALPTATFSFEQKFVQITKHPLATTNISITSVVWKWSDEEVAAGNYTEEKFELWKYGTGWSKVTATRDTAANRLSVQNMNPASVYGILQNNATEEEEEKPPEPEEEKDYTVSIRPACGGFTVTVKGEGNPVANALVTGMDETHGTELTPRYTDSSGQAYYQTCDIDVSVKAVKSGRSGMDSGMANCGICDECVTNDDCLEAERCLDRQCVPVECACGKVEDHMCVEYSCCDDSDCPEGQSCAGNACYECTANDGCDTGEYCDMTEGEAGGTCEQVQCTCGKIEDHACVQYECCLDSDCSQGQICINNMCGTGQVDCPLTGIVGDKKSCTAKGGDQPCVSCDYVITDPAGKNFSGKTDAQGNFVLPLNMQGTYQVTLFKDGQPVKTISVKSLPRAAPVEPEKPTAAPGIATYLLWLLLLLLLIVLAVLYWRGRQKKAEPAKAGPAKTAAQAKAEPAKAGKPKK